MTSGADTRGESGCEEARGRVDPELARWQEKGWQAEVQVASAGSPCERSFELSTTAPRHEDLLPVSPRRVIEARGQTAVRTRNDVFDALYALAHAEAAEASVDSIRDGAFSRGQPLECAPGGCFETGKKWTYVWTRDTAYSVDLGLAAVDPVRARNSLDFKLSERRQGGDLQIVQDTGSGGSYPVSTDRVVWALGAERLLHFLEGAERDAFAARVLEAARNTIEHDRAIAFDERAGLYRGETSFLDWREQTYAPWTAEGTVHIGMSQALSTNAGHLRILELAARLAGDGGDQRLARRYGGWAASLREAIARRFAVPGTPLLSSFRPTGLDAGPARRFDLLGSALAVLSGVVTDERARALVAAYPHVPAGPPVVWPHEADVPIYHNRAIWPFVTAYWLRAARMVRNDAAVNLGVLSLVRAAARNLSHMENFEFLTGQPWVDDGPRSGPVVNSQRQLWSVAGYLSMVQDTLFGLELAPSGDGIRFRPYITRELRSRLFGAADTLVLRGFPYRGARITVVVELPAATGDREGAFQVGRVKLNGREIADRFLPRRALQDDNRISIELVDRPERGQTIALADASDREAIFAPAAPVVTRVRPAGSGLRIDFRHRDEQPERIGFRVYRDGEPIADRLAGDSRSFTDEDSRPTGPSRCYTVEAYYLSSGSASHRARPVCFAGPRGERQRTVRLTRGQAEFRATASGPHILELAYRNLGAINTGVTCAVRRVDVAERASGRVVGSGYVFLPHTGKPKASAGRSSVMQVELEAGQRYRVTLAEDERTVNMSAFRHFEDYTGEPGGADGARNLAEITAVELLVLSGADRDDGQER